MSILENLNALYETARDSVADKVETEGTYEAELMSVKFDPKNKWSDGTLVPKVSLTFKVLEGEQAGNVLFVNLNLNGRTDENRSIALQVFAGACRKLGVDVKGKNLTDTIKELGTKAGAKATIVATQNGEYLNTKIK